MLPSPSAPSAGKESEGDGEKEATKVTTECKRLAKERDEAERQLKHIKRVSMMATQEYGNLREQLDLELSLREKAESYAHEMLIKQKEANRQSMILLQQADPSVQLLKALEDVANVTKTLEQERLQRQRQVQGARQPGAGETLVKEGCAI
ncbi:Shootin-1 [Acipenser ruthenus]|uniref:Shootin-1 n=1 Tax=Acipenser ruthenus TaxID=7906 RepID=A0A444V605_ACIRT|nr:Shootin-1 [Acipenser ruthenus]